MPRAKRSKVQVRRQVSRRPAQYPKWTRLPTPLWQLVASFGSIKDLTSVRYTCLSLSQLRACWSALNLTSFLEDALDRCVGAQLLSLQVDHVLFNQDLKSISRAAPCLRALKALVHASVFRGSILADLSCLTRLEVTYVEERYIEERDVDAAVEVGSPRALPLEELHFSRDYIIEYDDVEEERRENPLLSLLDARALDHLQVLDMQVYGFSSILGSLASLPSLFDLRTVMEPDMPWSLLVAWLADPSHTCRILYVQTEKHREALKKLPVSPDLSFHLDTVAWDASEAELELRSNGNGTPTLDMALLFVHSYVGSPDVVASIAAFTAPQSKLHMVVDFARDGLIFDDLCALPILRLDIEMALSVKVVEVKKASMVHLGIHGANVRFAQWFCSAALETLSVSGGSLKSRKPRGVKFVLL